VSGRIKLALICLIGMAIGLFSARYIANGGFDLVAASQGPWKTWPSAGLNNMDPYTKAHFLAAGRLADNRREIVEYGPPRQCRAYRQAGYCCRQWDYTRDRHRALAA
jgi:hypothetical protein